ncbi:MAG: response regulator [Nitrospirota bacterium]|nr:response regulator [Nitrospirota bacterium]MDP2383265.1 response regulator [Nitrospirota bacterium]MDP3598921.1 response regulator [Nitrospirota bacterium]
MATILLIAEEGRLLEQLDAALRLLGHTVTLATEEQTGWMLFESTHPDITMLSLDLSEAAGIDLLRKLRDADSEAVVIGLTGDETGEQHRAARELGASVVLQKPFMPADLDQALRQLSPSPDFAALSGCPIASVLVVDDEVPILQLLRKTLEGAGYQVWEALTGNEGLRQVCAQPIDVVITDILMSDMDGLEMIGELHRNFPKVRIIAISGGSKYLDYCAVAKMLGAHETLNKPFELQQLLEAVARQVGEMSHSDIRTTDPPV